MTNTTPLSMHSTHLQEPWNQMAQSTSELLENKTNSSHTPHRAKSVLVWQHPMLETGPTVGCNMGTTVCNYSGLYFPSYQHSCVTPSELHRTQDLWHFYQKCLPALLPQQHHLPTCTSAQLTSLMSFTRKIHVSLGKKPRKSLILVLQVNTLHASYCLLLHSHSQYPTLYQLF